MRILFNTPLVLACAAAGLLAACQVDVRDGTRAEGGKDVDIRTPLGAISVATEVDTDTGLPVYPGARVRRSGDDPGSANVNVGTPFADVKVSAANYEHDDDSRAILAFYREAMRKYGEVVECRGDLDFKGRGRRMRPVCDERWGARDVTLGVGTETQQRLVVVKPRSTGSDFSVVYIKTS